MQVVTGGFLKEIKPRFSPDGVYLEEQQKRRPRIGGFVFYLGLYRKGLSVSSSNSKALQGREGYGRGRDSYLCIIPSVKHYFFHKMGTR